MSLGTLFKSDTRDLLDRFRSKGWASPEERAAACEELLHSNVSTADVVTLLFSTDAEVRRAVGRLLSARRDPETIKHFVGAFKGKPEAARRAALTVLASLPLGNVAAQLAQVEQNGEPAARKLAAEALLELPLTAETAPLLTRLIQHGEAAHRLRAVTRFAEIATEKHLPFFERLLDDTCERIRLAAWQVIVKHATPRHFDLFMQRVADEPYATQQVLVGAIQRLAPHLGEEALEQVLALLASGNSTLRTAALKILMSMPDRRAVVRRFIASSRNLAGWVRDRAIETMREFGQELLEPAFELLGSEDADIRSAALAMLAGNADPRVARAAAALLQDPDWWIAINAADLLARHGDPAAVPHLVQASEREDVRWAAVEALGRLRCPQSLEALAVLTRDTRPEIRIEALMALAASEDASVLPVLSHSAEHDPARWVRARACELASSLSRRKSVQIDEASLRASARAGAPAEGTLEIHKLLSLARTQQASDLHVSVDSPPALRVFGKLVRLEGGTLSAERCAGLLLPLLTPEQRQRLESDRQLDACFRVENDGRYRGNLFVDRKGLNGVFRVIPETPPNILDLGVPRAVADVGQLHQGIVIVTGPAGCGKTTTLAALVNLINETRRSHVLTLEDPVEFVHPFKSSLINQREVGRHTESFAAALRAALREDPDVIVIGEMRDAETVSLALTAAETGHLVLATLNATTAHKAVERVITSFPVDEQPQVRESFATSLRMILAQALVPAASGVGRVGCFELLLGTRAIANLIRDSKTFQIPSIMQIGQSAGMRIFDESLMELVRTGRITPESAYERATSREMFEPLVSAKFLEELNA